VAEGTTLSVVIDPAVPENPSFASTCSLLTGDPEMPSSTPSSSVAPELETSAALADPNVCAFAADHVSGIAGMNPCIFSQSG
jgi:hypothetical protein